MSSAWGEFVASDGVAFRFGSEREVLDYLRVESSKWSDISRGIRRLGPTAQLSGLRELFIDLLRFSDDSWMERMQQDKAAEVMSQARSTLEAYLGYRPAIHDRAPLQEFLLQIAQFNEAEAAWTLAWLAKKEDPKAYASLDSLRYEDIKVNGLSGIANAQAWMLRGRVATPVDELVGLANRARGKVNEIADEVASRLAVADDQVAQLRSLVESADAYAKSVQHEVTGVSTQLQPRLDETLKDASDKLDASWKKLSATYDNLLALRAPSTYWGAKQKHHAANAKYFGSSIAVAALVGLCGLWVLYANLFRDLKLSQVPTWGQVLPATLMAVLYLWTLKTLIRLTLSHIHLSLDAEERRTLILSYLAMSKLANITEDERKALSAAIFRSSGDGIIKDEAPPIPLFELFRAK